MRWKKIIDPTDKKTFIESVFTYCGAGSPGMKDGLSIHVFSFNKAMEKTAFYSSDGDLLIVPQEGEMEVKTEFGILHIKPLEILII